MSSTGSEDDVSSFSVGSDSNYNKKSRNILWRYFKRSKSNDCYTVKCNLCNKCFKIGKKATTSSVNYHLQSQHPSRYAEYFQLSSNEKRKKASEIDSFSFNRCLK